MLAIYLSPSASPHLFLSLNFCCLSPAHAESALQELLATLDLPPGTQVRLVRSESDISDQDEDGDVIIIRRDQLPGFGQDGQPLLASHWVMLSIGALKTPAVDTCHAFVSCRLFLWNLSHRPFSASHRPRTNAVLFLCDTHTHTQTMTIPLIRKLMMWTRRSAIPTLTPCTATRTRSTPTPTQKTATPRTEPAHTRTPRLPHSSSRNMLPPGQQPSAWL